MTHMNSPASSTLSRRSFLQVTAVAGSVLAAGGLLRLARRLRPVTLDETRVLMGTFINLRLVTDDARNGRAALAATLAEMERLIALFDHRRADSPLARLNQQGQLSQPPAELVEVITHAVRYGDLTGGAFDISIKPLVDAYSAGLHDPAAQAVLVDYRQIGVSAEEIQLRRPGMALTLDGIAKGRVVDGASATLQAHGFTSILVEAGGDLMGLGTRAEGQPWQLGVQHPRQPGALLTTLPVFMQAAATSGDYMHSFRQDHSAHHIIDPRRGMSPTELASVTVLAPSVMDADALSTALMVMGRAAGRRLLERLPHVEALFVTKALEFERTAGFPAL